MMVPSMAEQTASSVSRRRSWISAALEVAYLAIFAGLFSGILFRAPRTITSSWDDRESAQISEHFHS